MFQWPERFWVPSFPGFRRKKKCEVARKCDGEGEREGQHGVAMFLTTVLEQHLWGNLLDVYIHLYVHNYNNMERDCIYLCNYIFIHLYKCIMIPIRNTFFLAQIRWGGKTPWGHCVCHLCRVRERWRKPQSLGILRLAQGGGAKLEGWKDGRMDFFGQQLKKAKDCQSKKASDEMARSLFFLNFRFRMPLDSQPEDTKHFFST